MTVAARAVAFSAASVVAVALATSAAASTQLATQNVVVVRAESQSGHPYVAWQLASGWCANVVEVASSPTVGSDGSFFVENFVDGGVLDPAQTSWLSSSPSTRNTGSYYVHVEAYACDFSAGPEWSPVVKFDVTPPPPPPPAPPWVTIQLWDGFRYRTAVRVGNEVGIIYTANGSLASENDFDLNGRICIALTRGSRCWKASSDPTPTGEVRITPKMVVQARFTVYALLRGKVVGRRAFPVRH